MNALLGKMLVGDESQIVDIGNYIPLTIRAHMHRINGTQFLMEFVQDKVSDSRTLLEGEVGELVLLISYFIYTCTYVPTHVTRMTHYLR